MYYTLEKAAEILEMNPGDVNRLREQGKLRAFRDGANWKFRKEDVEKFLTDMIRERSSAAASDLLSSEDDDEGPTMLAADSSAFDAMLDAADISRESASAIVSAAAPDAQDDDLLLVEDEADDDLVLAPESKDDDLVLAPEDDELKLDDDFKLVDDAPATVDAAVDAAVDAVADASDEVSALTEDLASEAASSVDLAASDDDLLHLGSDSGLALLDDVGGSGISLGDDDDVVLGGGSSTGSGSGLSLNSDSGLALLGGSDADFQLDSGINDQPEGLELAKDDEDDGIFALAEEPSAAPVINMEKDADADAATELAVAEDDSIFNLSEEPNASAASDDSTSDSSSKLIEIDDDADPFTTDDGEDEASSVAEAAPSADDLFAVPETDASADPFGLGVAASAADSPFGAAPVGDSPFGAADASSPFGATPTADDAFGGSTFVQTDEPEAEVMAPRAAVASTDFSGKDLLLLIPCLILLLLATMGAYELCRTIWSYQEGSFNLTGPILETIAKMVHLI